MKIYKITFILSEYNRKKDKRETISKSEIVTETKNLKYAKAIFGEWRNELKATFSYSTRGVERRGSVQLFVPHVFDNGLLAYWPNDEKYIAREDFQDN